MNIDYELLPWVIVVWLAVGLLFAVVALRCFWRAAGMYRDRCGRAEHNLRACLGAARGEHSTFKPGRERDFQDEAWAETLALRAAYDQALQKIDAAGRIIRQHEANTLAGMGGFICAACRKPIERGDGEWSAEFRGPVHLVCEQKKEAILDAVFKPIE